MCEWYVGDEWSSQRALGEVVEPLLVKDHGLSAFARPGMNGLAVTLGLPVVVTGWRVDEGEQQVAESACQRWIVDPQRPRIDDQHMDEISGNGLQADAQPHLSVRVAAATCGQKREQPVLQFPPPLMDGIPGIGLRRHIAVGMKHGKPFNPDDRQKKVLTEAAVTGDLLGRLTAYSKRVEGTEVWKGKHWEFANMVELDQSFKGYAQIDERASWFYEAIGNTVGMQGRTLGFGQVYIEAQKDKTGAWLDGGKSYKLLVPPNAPVELFWSFTLYDNLTRGPPLSPQGAADISSRTKGLEVNADGSVDLYFSPQKPAGSNANYVMTLPNKGWFTYFRLYSPKESYFDKSWQLPDLEEIK
jgi:hypothetical protein